MKVVLQVVQEASVTINSEKISEIGKGFLLLVGYEEEDDDTINQKMVNKILKLRVFQDSNGKTNLSLKDVNGSILSVSQFTLAGDVKDGNRPSFTKAMKYEEGKKLYELFNEGLRKSGIIVKEGIYGADMKVLLINDGPFTLLLDSLKLFP